MKFGKSLGLLALLIPAFSFAAQTLQVSEQEQKNAWYRGADNLRGRGRWRG